METRANYVLLGVFTIAMALIAIIFSLWISKAEFAGVSTYDVVFSGPISGLAKGSDVRFNGIKVGEVKNLHIDAANPQHVIARISLDAETPIRTSTQATLEGQGFTGVTFIQLSAGNLKDPLLKPQFGQPPPQILAKPGALTDLLATGQSVAVQANEALAKINRVLDDKTIENLHRSIAQLRSASEAIAAKDGAVDQITHAAHSIGDLSDRAHGTLDKVDAAAGGFRDSAEIASTQTLPNISAAARDLRRLSASLENLSAELETGQTSLIPGASPAKPVIKVRP